MALAAALTTQGRHPDLEARQDALLLGIYRCLRVLVSQHQEPPEDIPELSSDWLTDLIAVKRLRDREISNPT